MKEKSSSVELSIQEFERTKEFIHHLKSENDNLKQDLRVSLEIVLKSVPLELSNLIEKALGVSNGESYLDWEYKALDEILEMAYHSVKDIDFKDLQTRAYCPLCEKGLSIKPMRGNEGRTLPEGLKRHLLGTGRHNKCEVLRLLQRYVSIYKNK